jgi:hypothetical protein
MASEEHTEQDRLQEQRLVARSLMDVGKDPREQRLKRRREQMESA